jgi:hypothetical protein
MARLLGAAGHGFLLWSRVVYSQFSLLAEQRQPSTVEEHMNHSIYVPVKIPTHFVASELHKKKLGLRTKRGGLHPTNCVKKTDVNHSIYLY